MSKITVNLTEQEVLVPDTGLYTGTGQTNGAVIGVGALLLLFAVIGITIKIVNKNKGHRNFAKNKKFHISKAPIIGLSALVIVFTAFCFAATHQEASVDSVSAAEGNGDTLSIAVEDVELNITPSDEGTFGTARQIVKVSAPTETGYTLGVYADSADLVNEDDKEKAIKGLGGSELITTLSTNTWGFSLQKPENETSEVWRTMPTVSDNIAILKEVEAPTSADDATELYYGVNANTDLPSGKYSTTINYVAVANGPIVYMQDTATIESELTESGDAMRVVDNRDDKYYWIAKMADGNIWMTQNLDLDIDSDTTYTSVDTDLPLGTTWKPSIPTYAENNNTWNSVVTIPESHDAGDIYFYSSGTDTTDIAFASLGECMATGHTRLECAHYHAGNYYNWTATVASNNTQNEYAAFDNAPGSICPAGWSLPIATDSEGTAASREYNALLYAEGVAASATGDGFTTQGFNKIRSNPLYFPRAGVYNGSLQQSGQSGQYWTSTADTENTNTSYLFRFSNQVLVPASNTANGGGLGASVRCVLKQ